MFISRFSPVLLPVLGLDPGLNGGSPPQFARGSGAGGPDVVQLGGTALRPTKTLPAQRSSGVGTGVLHQKYFIDIEIVGTVLPSQWQDHSGDLPAE